jgi:hypothetical protein
MEDVMEKMEPGCTDRENGYRRSIAISAKRQADALERIAEALHTMAGEMAHPEYGIAPTLRDLGRGR